MFFLMFIGMYFEYLESRAEFACNFKTKTNNFCTHCTNVLPKRNFPTPLK